MIDFRYHLVSIVAVFLALAIGIVLGSTELQGPVYNALEHTTSLQQGELANANGQKQAAQQALAADESWLSANEGTVLHGMLAGQKVLIVTEPGAQSSVISGLTTAAGQAGATVTGRVDLTTKFFDTSGSTSASLAALNSSLAAQTGVQLDSGLSDQQQAAMRILAGALLDGSDTTGTVSSVPAGTANTMLQAYAQDEFLSVPGSPPVARASLVMLVTPQSIPADGSQDALAQVLGPIAQELAKVTCTVVAGTAAASGAGSPIAVLRGTNVSDLVSSVDDADTTVGQIAVIEALRNQLTGGKPGSWGREAGSPSYPDVSPAPGASTSATPPAGGSGKKPKR